MRSYEDRFKTLFTEKDEITDSAALASVLDKGTDPKDFDVNAPAGMVGQLPPELTEFQARMYTEIESWISKMTEFKDFLNGPDSIQTKINGASQDTILKKIGDAESKKVSRVAMELGSLIEIFRGYAAGAGSSRYKGQ
jgi:hypothetical protein